MELGKHLMKACALMSVIAMAISLFTLVPEIIIFTSLLSLGAIALYRLWDVIEAVLFRRTNLIQVVDGCELGRDRQVALRRVGGGVVATSAAVLNVTTVRDIDRDGVENIIAHTGYPMRFSVQVARLDTRKIVDDLETKRGVIEIKLARLKNSNPGNLVETCKLERQLEAVTNDIKNISSGDMPLKMVCYIATSAISESAYGAEERAKSQIRELAGQFDALVGGKSKLVCGSELIDLLKIDSMVMT